MAVHESSPAMVLDLIGRGRKSARREIGARCAAPAKRHDMAGWLKRQTYCRTTLDAVRTQKAAEVDQTSA